MKGNAKRNGQDRTRRINEDSVPRVEGRPQRCETKGQAKLRRRRADFEQQFGGNTNARGHTATHSAKYHDVHKPGSLK